MQNVLIINAHEPYSFSEGRLNRSLAERMKAHLEGKGYDIKTTVMTEDYDVQEEVEKHVWADVIIVQSPLNWMSVPWSFKKYQDMVYSAGMMGPLSNGDGRTRSDASRQYGSGGAKMGSKYMFSLTLNAPRDAFDDSSQEFFAGKGVDDLLWPGHLNFRFFGMEPIETFACYDVLKNPDVERDFERLEEHMERNFPALK